MTAPLKPCPFCGAKAQMLGGPEAQETYSVWCKAKGRRHHIHGTMDADQTAAIWNTRTDAPELVALIDAADRLRNGINLASLVKNPHGIKLRADFDAALAAYEALK